MDFYAVFAPFGAQTAPLTTLRAIPTDGFHFRFIVLEDFAGNASPGISPVHTEGICIIYGMSLILVLFSRTV